MILANGRIPRNPLIRPAMVQARSSLEDIGLPGPENKVRFLLEIQFNRFQRRGAKPSLEIDSPIV